MRMRHRDRQRIGGVRLQRPLEAEQYTDHVLHLGLVAAAAADHGLLYFGCCVFVHHDPPTDHRTNRSAARLSELQCRIRITRHEHALDPALDGLMGGDDVT
jgi:hypothetical protein